MIGKPDGLIYVSSRIFKDLKAHRFGFRNINDFLIVWKPHGLFFF